jgi:hypothetical protein
VNSGESSLNERITFLVSAISAELTTSVLFHMAFPAGPLAVGFPGILTYVGEHGTLALAFWVAVLAFGWVTQGSRLSRSRQNLSTKLWLLGWLGLAGVLIDNTSSYFLFSTSAEPIVSLTAPSALVLALVERSLIYVSIFGIAVLVCYLISRNQRPTDTPPPRFKREY